MILALSRALPWRLAAIALATTAAMSLAACGASDKNASGGTKAPAASEKGAAKAAENPQREEKGIKLSPEEREAAGIRVEPAKPQPVKVTITVTATIRANQDRIARVAPRVEGRIVAVSANLGDRPAAGQTLATLDSLEVGEASSTYQQALSAHRLAQADMRRAESLNAEEIIPVKEFARARSELEKASAALRAAEDRLRMLGVPPDPAVPGHAVSTFPVVAPFAGTVIEKRAIPGELARPDQPMFTVADLSRLWIEANLAEQDLVRVRPGAPAAITVSAYPNERFQGRVTYVASVLDKESRTVPTRIEVDNRDGRLKLEMFATATIEVPGAKREAFAVPDEAIVLLQGQPTVFIEEEQGFGPRPVEPGERLAGRTVLKSGLVGGEKVVTAGAYALKARLLKSQIGQAE